MSRGARLGVRRRLRAGAVAVLASIVLAGCSGLPIFSFGDFGGSTATEQPSEQPSEQTGKPTGSPEGVGGSGGGPTGAGSIPEGAWPATVTYVHDGDTLYLLPDDYTNAGSTSRANNSSTDELKVRLIGIDTPEVGEYAECYGEEATELLRDFLPEGTHVWAIEDDDPFDPYGRSLLYVFTDDGYFVNFDMVSLGAAEAVLFQPNDEYYGELRDVEREAQDARLGMWGACR